MDEALVQDPEHDVDHEDRDDEERDQSLLRVLEDLRRSIERAGHVLRQDRERGGRHRVGRLAERDAELRVERDRHARHLPRVVHQHRAQRRRRARHARQRHELPGSRSDVQHAQRAQIALVFRQQLEDHPVFVLRGVDRAHLARTVRVVQRGLDLLRRELKARGRVAVEFDGRLRVGDLQVGGDIDDAVDLAHLRFHRLRRLVQRRQVAARHRVLVLPLGCAAADLDGGRVHDIGRDSRHRAQRGAEHRHEFVGRELPLLSRLQPERDAPRIHGRR